MVGPAWVLLAVPARRICTGWVVPPFQAVYRPNQNSPGLRNPGERRVGGGVGADHRMGPAIVAQHGSGGLVEVDVPLVRHRALEAQGGEVAGGFEPAGAVRHGDWIDERGEAAELAAAVHPQGGGAKVVGLGGDHPRALGHEGAGKGGVVLQGQHVAHWASAPGPLVPRKCRVPAPL